MATLYERLLEARSQGKTLNQYERLLAAREDREREQQRTKAADPYANVDLLAPLGITPEMREPVIQQGSMLESIQTERSPEERRKLDRAAHRRSVQAARDEKQRIEDETIRPGGTIDYYKAKFNKGFQTFGAGLNTTVAAVLEELGQNELAQTQRMYAADRDWQAHRKVEGETTGEEVWNNPSFSNIMGFIGDTGVESLPQMAAAIASIPLYVASLAGNTGTQRARNNGEEQAQLADIIKGLPTSVVSAYLDRMGLKLMFGAAAGRLGLAGGKTAVGRIGAATGVGAVAEGVTEGVQSGLEYAGGSVGTERGFDEEEALKQMVLGSLAGQGMGAGFSGGGRTMVELSDATARGVQTVRDRYRPSLGDPDPAYGTAEEAAIRALSNPSAPRISGTLTARPRGVREEAEGSAPSITPGDIESPLPTEAISRGRQIMDAVRGKREADTILQENGAPGVGTRVRVNYGDRVVEGVIEDSFVIEDPQAGRSPGVKIAMADGTTFDEHFSTIRDLGIKIEPIAAPALRRGAAPAEPAPPAAPAPARPSRPPPGGLTGGIEGYLAATRAAESSGDDNADNPRSSADGRYQFIDSTFRAYYKKVYGTDPGRRPPKELKNNVEVQERLMRAFTEDNAKALQAAGVPINNGTLYAAHHFGSGGAIEMGRNPGAPVSADVVSANPQLRGMTNGQALDWAQRYVSGGKAGAAAAAGGSAAPTITFAERPRAEGSSDPVGNILPQASKADAEPGAPKVDTTPLPQPARDDFPELNAEAEPEVAARQLARDLLARGFTTNGIGRGYRFANDNLNIRFPDGRRPQGNRINVEIDTPAGPRPFSFRRSELAREIAAAEAPATVAAPPETPAPTRARLEPTKGGKGLVIYDASESDMAAIRSALPQNTSLVRNSSGGFVVSRKHEDAIRTALTPTVVTVADMAAADRAREMPVIEPIAVRGGFDSPQAAGQWMSENVDANERVDTGERTGPIARFQVMPAEEGGYSVVDYGSSRSAAAGSSFTPPAAPDPRQLEDSILGMDGDTYVRFLNELKPAPAKGKALVSRMGHIERFRDQFDDATIQAAVERTMGASTPTPVAPAPAPPRPVATPQVAPMAGMTPMGGKAGVSEPKVVRYLPRDDGRYGVQTGAVLTTVSGRKLPPAPKFDDSTPTKTKLSLARQRDWLLDEAIKEAENLRGDSLARPMLLRMKANPKNLSPSDYGTINDILFGDYNGPSETGGPRGEDALASIRTGPRPAEPAAGPRVIINRIGADGLSETERAAGKAPLTDAPQSKAEESGTVTPDTAEGAAAWEAALDAIDGEADAIAMREGREVHAEPTLEQIDAIAQVAMQGGNVEAAVRKAIKSGGLKIERGGEPAPANVKPMEASKVVPAPAATVKVEDSAGAFISPAEAERRLAAWKAEAKRIGAEGRRDGQIILSLFDASGVFAQPYRDMGFEVHQLDLKSGTDLLDNLREVTETVRGLTTPGARVVGVLAQPPCTTFTASGARWWGPRHDRAWGNAVRRMFGSRATTLFDSPIEYNQFLVAATEELIAASGNPDFFVIENPAGRIERMTGLPKPLLVMQPHHFGDPYTKRTHLWGRFNTDLPTANVDPVEGSRAFNLRSTDEKEAGLRSLTSEPFAYAFALANAPGVTVSDDLPGWAPTRAPAAAPAVPTITLERKGDFYEATGDSAATVGKALDIAVTEVRGQPIVGFPRHSADRYGQQLADAGFRVELRGPEGIVGTFEPTRTEAPTAEPDAPAAKPKRQKESPAVRAGREAAEKGEDRTVPPSSSIAYGEDWLRGFDAAEREMVDQGGDTAAEVTKRRTARPSPNKIFTEDAAERARALLKSKLSGSQLNAGLDPEIVQAGITLAGYHIERGLRSFAAYAEAMVADLGDTAIPYLRGWYEAVRFYPGMEGVAKAMSSPEDIGAALARLEDRPQSVTRAAEETPDAGPTETSRARVDDRSGDEGSGASDVPRAEGERRAGGRGRGKSEGGEGDLRDPVERGGARSGERQARDDGDSEGARGDDGAKQGGRDGNRPSRRVRSTARGSNYLAPKGSLTRQGGWRATAERNLDIIELVNKLDAEGRPATVEEQALLAKFTGWGASEMRNNLFRNVQRDPSTGERSIPEGYYGEWKDTQTRASRLLRGEQLEQALQSTQYAHYTSETIIRSIWDAVRRLGFNGGKIMEPGMGIGLFAAAAPAEVMDASSYTGIELDAFSAKIAGYLLPQENVVHNDFVKQSLPDGFFDVAIGNPPFSGTRVLDDPAYKRHRLVLHDYFFAKSIDKVRPGGLLVFVTSKGTMDKLGDKGRAYIAERADLLGAIRLPQTAFRENAGTEVVTDVLIFQRRMPGAAPGGEAWLKTEPIKVGQHTFQINEYFARNPIMVLGKHSAAGTMYSKFEYTVEPTANIEGQFANAINFLPENVYSEAVVEAVQASRAKAWEADMRPSSEKEGGLYIKDGKVFVREQGVGKPVSALDKVTAADEAWLKGYAGVRDALKQAQKDQLSEGDWESSLKALNKAYDSFVKAHGPIQASTVTERKSVDEDGNEKVTVYRRLKNQRLLDLDVESPLIFGLEKVSDEGVVTKGDFLTGRTLNKPTRPKIESVQDAMAVGLDELGRLDLDYIGSLMKRDRAAVIEALGDGIYKTPGGVWQTADEYLSGDVLVKLEEAKAAAQADPAYNRNVEALAAVQPKPLGPQDINVKLGAGWIPVDVVKLFAKDVVGVDVETIQYEPATAEWGMDGKGARSSRSASEEYGTSDRSPQEILTAVLNNQTIKVTRRDSDGKTWTDQEATAAANEVANKMSARFKTWAWEDAKRASALLDIYNRKFNNLAPRRFDGSHLTFPGLSANYSLYDHQKRAIWRQIQTGNVYLAHAVGAGKTLEMIVGGMEQKRLGLIKKPMYVVPNHMLQQFAREFMEAYPAASIMVADEKAFHTDNRRRFMAQASLNDPDAIIVTHSSFGKLGTKPESREAVVQTMIAELEAALEGSDTRYTVAKIEKQIEALKRSFESKTGSGKDQALTFEEMGVDYVYVDEAHLFRKLDYATNRNVKGIDPKGSQRALDLYIKTRWLEQQRPGRSLTLASGTPVTNTMAEIYTVMRYMNEGELERDGLRAFDAWANMFGEVAAGYEQNAAGGYEIVERFAKFVNVPELMKRVRTFMDVLTSENLGDLVKRPKVNGGVPHSVVSPPIDTLKDYMQGELKARIAASRAWKPSKDEPANPDPIIAINTDARLASIDMRFIRPGIANDPGSKLNVMIDRIIERHKALKAISYVNPRTGQKEPTKGGTQIVFSAVGFGEGAQINRGFDLRGWLDGRLMKEAGLKKSEIAWMSDANTHAKKEALFKDMRAGRIRVLVGSPANMGTGVNVQNRLKALHFLAPPWYPADVEQPHGRIIRQGNWNEDVDLYWYATKGTYDSTAWGMVSRKARFIEQAMSGDDSVRSLEDISEANQYEMAAALAAGDERIIQIAGFTSDIERLSRLEGAHAEEQMTLGREERYRRQELQRQRERVTVLEDAVKARDPAAEFELTVDGKSYGKQGEAGEALKAALVAAIEARQAIPTMQLATYQGKHAVGIAPTRRGSSGEFVVTVKVADYETEITQPVDNAAELDATGLGSRVQNAVARLPADLRKAQADQTEIESELRKIERKLGAPFAQAQELAEKVAERANLQRQLAEETAAAEAAAKAAPAAPGPAAAVNEPGRVFSVWEAVKGAVTGPSVEDSTTAPARRGGTVRALGIAADLRSEKAAALVGREAGTPDDLAALAQVYRDPRFETLRVFFTKGQKIVHATGVSSRRPNVAPLLPKNGDEAAFHTWLKETMASSGADGFYLLHNHPSGDPTPSRTDERVTTNTAAAVPGFKGHVIINSNRYAVIDRAGAVKVKERDFGEDRLMTASKPHPVLGMEITDTPALAALGKMLQRPEHVTVIGVDTKLRVRVVVDYSTAELQRPKFVLLGALRRIRRLSGSDRFFLVGTAEAIATPAVQEAVRQNVVLEAIDEAQRPTGLWRDPTPSPLDTIPARFVASEREPFAPAPIQDDAAFEGETEQRWQDATRGIGDGPGWIEKARGWWADIAAGFSRHWRALPNEPRFAQVQQQFRRLEAAPEAATEEVVRRLTSMVKGFNKGHLDLFSRKVVLDDLQWETDVGHKLPFGFTPETLAAARARVDAAVALPKNKVVADAVRRRKLVNKQLADEMVQAGVLTREQIKNPAYYRHMVLEYARAEMRNARTPGSKIKSPYWAKRMGSSLDINANLLEAEFDWMQKALVDITTAKVIEWLKRSDLNIREDLRAQAKASNKEKIAALVAADTKTLGKKKVRGPIAKADLYYRQLTARGMNIVRDELLAGNLDVVPAHLQSAADALANGTKGDPPFAFFAWILDNDKPGSMGAAMALKAAGQRKAWEQKLLKDEYLDAEDMTQLVKRLAPEGYAAWQPREGQHMFTAKTISESTIDMFIERLADTDMPGLDHNELARALGSLRSQLVPGGDRYTMVLPEEVVDTLNEFGDRRQAGMVAQLFGGLQGAWKRWMLINPRRILKYNINNLTGDLDAIIAGNPRSLRRVAQAGRELEAVMRRKQVPTDRYKEAVERGVFTSGLSVQEIPDINRFSSLRHLTDQSRRPDKMFMQALGAFWRASQGFTQWRENVFRYAAYLDYADRLEAGEAMEKIGYGASVPKMVDAVTDPKDKAALLARDLVGDYGSISVVGAWLRKYLIPFWSWTEINTKRYWRLTGNAFGQSTARGLAVGGLMGASITAKMAVWLALRMATVYGALWLWNNLLFGDEEDELGEMQRRQLHLILGRDSDGKVMTLRTQGALSDVLSMFGFADAVKGWKNYEEGQGSIGDVAKAMVKAPINRVAGGTTPFIGEPVEQMIDKELWPDAFNPRQIHDNWRHLFQTVNLENETDWLRDKPTRGYARSWTESLVYRRDAGEMAYDDAKGMAYDWLERVKGETGGGASSPRSEALREYRQGIRFGDIEAANRALDRYEALGGTLKSFKQSLKRQHPLGPIPKKDRQAFVDSLTPEEYETLLEAEEFYNRTFLGAAAMPAMEPAKAMAPAPEEEPAL